MKKHSAIADVVFVVVSILALSYLYLRSTTTTVEVKIIQFHLGQSDRIEQDRVATDTAKSFASLCPVQVIHFDRQNTTWQGKQLISQYSVSAEIVTVVEVRKTCAGRTTVTKQTFTGPLDQATLTKAIADASEVPAERPFTSPPRLPMR